MAKEHLTYIVDLPRHLHLSGIGNLPNLAFTIAASPRHAISQVVAGKVGNRKSEKTIGLVMHNLDRIYGGDVGRRAYAIPEVDSLHGPLDADQEAIAREMGVAQEMAKARGHGKPGDYLSQARKFLTVYDESQRLYRIEEGFSAIR